MNEKIGWGIIGTGWIAGNGGGSLCRQGFDTLWPSVQNTREGRRVCPQASCRTAYGSYEEVAADPRIDVVYIATPHPYHCANTLLCLKNGKAVLCEKPFAMNEKGSPAHDLRGQGTRCVPYEAFWTRLPAFYHRVLELVASGVLGEVPPHPIRLRCHHRI